jgi:cytochrome c peroxidase
MKKAYWYVPLLIFLVSGLSFLVTEPPSRADLVRQYYHGLLEQFKKETALLEAADVKGNQQQLREQFLKTRLAYKRTEVFTEYFFAFYAGKLNGPPIPFFEESEPDRGEQPPAGMQLVESFIFPKPDHRQQQALQFQLSELNRYAIELPTITESFAFNDNNILDALMEQMFRLSSMGITGFDSQVAVNGLPETAASLESIRQVLSFYKDGITEQMPGKYQQLDQLLQEAVQYISKHPGFDKFDRMHFFRSYLDPITRIIGAYKQREGFSDNESGRFYSAVKKSGSLFDKTAFNPNRFLDDFSSSPAKIALGKKLFFEPALSSNKMRSCASCHQPGKGFADGLKTSMALDGHSPLPRNAPTIWNAALQRNLFLDGRGKNLEDQVFQVLNNAKEMHGSAKQTAGSIINEPGYKELYQTAYPGTGKEKAAENICNAIACFERTLISLDSR